MSLQLMIRYSDGDGGISSARGGGRWWDMWRDIIMDGFAASIGNDAERAYAFVFFVGGILLLLGGTLQYYIRKEQKPVPLFLGYSLLLVSVVGYILLPLSSFWLLIPQELIMIGGTSMGVKGY